MLSYLLDFWSCLIKRPDSHRNVPLGDLQTADEGGKSFLHVLILLLQYDKGEVVGILLCSAHTIKAPAEHELTW